VRGQHRSMRLLTFAVVCAAALTLPAAGAFALRLGPGPGHQVLRGTASADSLFGGAGDDALYGRGGDDRLGGGWGTDTLSGGPGHDTLRGGPGDDLLVAADGAADTVDCGPGRDLARVDALDRVAANCEEIEGGHTGPPRPMAPAVPPSPPPRDAAEQPEPPAPEPDPALEPPEPKLPEERVPFALFPAGHGWTGNGEGSLSEAGPPFVLTGDRSLKIESDGSGDESVATSPVLEPLDFRRSHVLVESLISFSAHLGTVKLRLSSGDIETDYAEATLWREGSDPIGLDSSFEPQTVPIGAFQVVGRVDWSRIDRAQLVLTDNETGKVSLYVAGIYAVNTLNHPIVSFAFDDGHQSTYADGLWKLSQYGYPATAYVISGAVGEPGYVTLDQLRQMRTRFHWEIGGHAATIAAHNEPRGLDSLGPEALETEMDSLRDWLDQSGFPRETFAYPKGAAGEEVRRYAERDYCAGRTTAAGPETIPPRNDYTIRGWSIDGRETSVASLEAAIDRAVAENAWLILSFHELVPGQPRDPTQFSIAGFDEIVDYIHSLNGADKPKIRTVAAALGC
jgi:peptidoglycan/xylan/chitin deacetylase (PgdA/CDA1 family)